MIYFSDQARNYIASNGIKEVYLVLTYKRGPCEDNLCRMIPRIEVASSVSEGTEVVPLDSDFIKVYAVPPVAKAVSRTKKSPQISLTRVTKKLRIDGVSYSF